MSQNSPLSVAYRKIRAKSDSRESPADRTRSKTNTRREKTEDEIINKRTPIETTEVKPTHEAASSKNVIETAHEAVASKEIIKTLDETVLINKIITPAHKAAPIHKIVTPAHEAKQKTVTMNQKTIQENIVCTIKELNCDGTRNIENELTKFLDAADMLYEQLETDEERAIFNKLIKFRLNGEAYSRISHRNIANYDEFKQTLRSMFLPAYSLDELEKRCMEGKQKYGESINNFGDRLTEALEEYKQGYKTKYGIRKIDEAYAKHLESNVIQAFRRGLNNIILKEKVATIKANNIREIIHEAIDIERMLSLTVDSPNVTTNFENSITKTPVVEIKPTQTILQTICNYCNKPNHTWDICRTRMFAELRAQNDNRYRQTQFTQPNFQNFSRQPNRSFRHNEPIIQERYRQADPSTFRNYRDRIRPQTSNNFINQWDRRQQPTRPRKYCTFCKTTSGHTFEECRNKFYNRDKPRTTDHEPQQAKGNNDLEDHFKNLKINLLNAQLQENSTGSNQM